MNISDIGTLHMTAVVTKNALEVLQKAFDQGTELWSLFNSPTSYGIDPSTPDQIFLQGSIMTTESQTMILTFVLDELIDDVLIFMNITSNNIETQEAEMRCALIGSLSTNYIHINPTILLTPDYIASKLNPNDDYDPRRISLLKRDRSSLLEQVESLFVRPSAYMHTNVMAEKLIQFLVTEGWDDLIRIKEGK